MFVGIAAKLVLHPFFDRWQIQFAGRHFHVTQKLGHRDRVVAGFPLYLLD